MLLVSSYIFYGWWDWRFLSLILFSTIVDYFVGIQIHSQPKKHKKIFLIISIGANLGLLCFFKYFNFFIDSWIDLWALLGYKMELSTISIILPVGISFYTFQTMSYSIDIYRGKLEPTKDFIAFATFVSFFPQLVAGPIERASNLLPQILNKRKWSHERMKAGLFQIGIGFFRKVVVADSIGNIIGHIYDDPSIHNASSLLMAIILYSFQIYFDFSGYSDIAIGTAKLLGFDFKRNFNLPYFSSSVTEFWRRWHISLSTWLRDYLYIPLGGNRKGLKIQYRNLLITMLLGGLWHGSSWNFVIWGGVHGIALGIEKRFLLISKRYKILNNIFTFMIVALAWVFFRAQSLSDSTIIFTKLFTGPYLFPYLGDINIFATLIYSLFISLCLDFYLYRKDISLEEIGCKLNPISYHLLFTFIIINIALFYSDSNNFIYFQF